MSTSGMIMVNPDLGRKEWISLESFPFFEKLMASKKTLHLVKDTHSLLLWFKCSPVHYYSSKVNIGNWLYELLEKKFPAKMQKPLDDKDKCRWQMLAWKELKSLR